MKLLLFRAVVLLAAAPLAHAASLGYGRPLSGGKGAGDGLSPCRIEAATGTPGCSAPDPAPLFVIPAARWGDAVENAGCSPAERGGMAAALESQSALFNQGLLLARKAAVTQILAQEGVDCARAVADWDGYAGKQSSLFLSRWDAKVQDWIAKCPPAAPADAPKKRKRPAARPAMCRDDQNWKPYPDECKAIPDLRGDSQPAHGGYLHANLQACTETQRTQTKIMADARLLNLNVGLVFCNRAANLFLQAQTGSLCAETVESYEAYLARITEAFDAAWLSKTAGIGAACRK